MESISDLLIDGRTNHSALKFNSIYVSSKTLPDLDVLLNVSGEIKQNEFCAIMGPSNSGKTTLLSCLSSRLNLNFMNVKGEVLLNGNNENLRSKSVFTMQDDLLVFDSTVHETITFAAKLRLSEMTIRERTQRELDVMHLMDIHQFRNKLIGDYIDFPERAVTLSVRKRLCVAMELLTKPQFIFMDYPALGLTSSEAYSFCLSLKNLVVTGVCGVVCTLHNPSYHVYYSFDRVLLLQCGEMVYQGNVSNALISFTQCGLHVPNVSDEEETEAEFNYRTATLTEQTLRQLAGGDRQRLLDAQGIRRQQERNQPRTDADRVRRYWSKRYREMCDRVRKLFPW